MLSKIRGMVARGYCFLAYVTMERVSNLQCCLLSLVLGRLTQFGVPWKCETRRVEAQI